MADEIISPLAPETSPLAEADPNSLNELIAVRVEEAFNMQPLLLTDDHLRACVEYYRRERARFLIESQNKPARATAGTRRTKAPTSVADALASSTDLL
jgi:hypothetical protein